MHNNHTHWQVAQSSLASQNLPKSMAAPTHGRKESTGIQHCIRAIAGEVVKSRSVHLINFGGGGQLIALKSATALILYRYLQPYKSVYNNKMISKHLKEIFDPYVNLDIGVWENFEKLGEIKILPKETILKESNTTEKNFNLIIKGSGGNLIWNKNNFVCIDISFENDFLNDYMSFTTQRPTPIEVRLFEDATIFSISYNNFQQTLEVSNYGEKITRLAVETVFIEKQQQQIDLLTKTAKERYIELMQDKNGVDRIPLKYLASYLGITPQSLSRIRAEKI